MASGSLLPSLNVVAPIRTSTHIFPTHSITNPLFISLQQYNSKKKKKSREFSLPSVASIPYEPINVDYLESKFDGRGVTFETLDENCIARLSLANGSEATLMLPSGLITSYKARMWHGGSVELLQTSVLEGRDDGYAFIQGGVSPAFTFGCDDGVGGSFSPSSWSLHDVQGHSRNSVQIEMSCNEMKDMVDLKYIMTLNEDSLTSEFVVTNLRPSSIKFMGSIISHLTVSTPEATYVCGMEGSSFFDKPIFSSEFSIVPDGTGDVIGVHKLWELGGTMYRSRQVKVEEEIENEEDDSYKNLADVMSRIYTSAPRNLTFIDRGRRNSVVIGRTGFDELYIFSPGSGHEMYGQYSYICVGQSAMLKPVTINSGGVWQGRQRIHNPNLD